MSAWSGPSLGKPQSPICSEMVVQTTTSARKDLMHAQLQDSRSPKVPSPSPEELVVDAQLNEFMEVSVDAWPCRINSSLIRSPYSKA